MPRQRNPENRGLPARWRHYHGGYYYQVPAGLESAWDGKKQYRLGATIQEAYKVWAERVSADQDVRTINDLLDRYFREVVPLKAASSRRADAQNVIKLRSVFGGMGIGMLTPQDIYLYFDRRRRKGVTDTGKARGGPVVARHEIALLSHACTKAVEWGYIPRHPFKGEVRLAEQAPRTRYVEDWEIAECLALPTDRKRGSIRVIQAYIRLKLLTGLRAGDLLRLKESAIQDDGIHVTTSKTGKPVIYEWSPELREAVESARRVRPLPLSPFLFCTRRGKSYMDDEAGTASGWHSMWQRFMARILKETAVRDRFTEHDLRAKCASDAATLEHARSMLAHADSRTTNRIYRRRPERVRPAR
jgi:integrase